MDILYSAAILPKVSPFFTTRLPFVLVLGAGIGFGFGFGTGGAGIGFGFGGFVRIGNGGAGAGIGGLVLVVSTVFIVSTIFIGNSWPLSLISGVLGRRTVLVSGLIVMGRLNCAVSMPLSVLSFSIAGSASI